MAPTPNSIRPSSRKHSILWALAIVFGFLLIFGGLFLMIGGPILKPFHNDSLLAIILWFIGGVIVFWAGTGLSLVSAFAFRDSREATQDQGSQEMTFSRPERQLLHRRRLSH